jgi:hypothetical protein
MTATAGQTVDIVLTYNVKTISGLPLINMIDQQYTLGGGTGTINIGETVRSGASPFSPVVAQSTLTATHLTSPPATIAGDNLNFSPLPQVWVSKDIFLQATNTVGNSVGATSIIQSFHQVGVPDGGTTVVLLGAALSGLALLRRKLA